MDSAVISRIIQAAAALDPAHQGYFIAAEAIAASRAADAAISNQEVRWIYAAIAVIVEASRALPPDEQGQYIARRAIAAARSADAGLSDQALEAELRAWCKKWGRHG